MSDNRTSNQRLIEWVEDTLTGLDVVLKGGIVGWPAHIREGQKLLTELRAVETPAKHTDHSQPCPTCGAYQLAEGENG